jgi:predicted enzyme related to lactoylglutathione lyase
MKSLISHVEFNVIDYRKSVRFYDLIFPYMGLEKINSTKEYTAYTDGMSKIILNPTPKGYEQYGFHRKKPGLNHLAFYAPTMEKVKSFYNDVLKANDIPSLYEAGPSGDENYYAVFFEDPDRIKLEYVFAPNYCDKCHWPNN